MYEFRGKKIAFFEDVAVQLVTPLIIVISAYQQFIIARPFTEARLNVHFKITFVSKSSIFLS